MSARPQTWVIDTNVLVSAVLTPGGTCDRILRAAVDGRIRLAWNAPMVAEYRAVLLRPKFGLSTATVSALLAAFGPADQVSLRDVPPLPDPDDEVFLAAALATDDKILVTGNRAHFPAASCSPVRVLSPAEAVQELEKS
jgi:putative PIN family toxin of toxin-antitoxin system